MVSRRGLVIAGIGAGAVVLGGCVPWSMQSRVNRAAESVEGVESSALDLGTGGTFGPQLTGDIHCSVEADELEEVFDSAWREVVTLLHGSQDGGREVTGVTCHGADGSALSPRMWFTREDTNAMLVSDFFERYDLG